MARKALPKKRCSPAVTRQKLLKSGACAFAKHGMSDAKIDEIAKHARIAVGTFYLYFKDKAQLFDAVMEEGETQIMAALDLGITPDQDLLSDRAQNRKEIGQLVDYARQHADLFQVLLSRRGSDDPTRQSVIGRFTTLRTKQLERGQKNGRFFPNRHADLTARGEIGFIAYVLDWWLKNPSAATREQVIETLVETRMFGVERRRPE